MVVEVSGWFTLLTAGFGLIGLLAGLVAFARASYAKSTIDTLKESNAALTERVDMLESERTHYKGVADTKTAEVAVLERALSGRDDITRLESELQSHREVLLARLQSMDGRLDDLLRLAGDKRGRDE